MPNSLVQMEKVEMPTSRGSDDQKDLLIVALQKEIAGYTADRLLRLEKGQEDIKKERLDDRNLLMEIKADTAEIPVLTSRIDKLEDWRSFLKGAWFGLTVLFTAIAAGVNLLFHFIFKGK